jgi:hypothetical protein
LSLSKASLTGFVVLATGPELELVELSAMSGYCVVIEMSVRPIESIPGPAAWKHHEIEGTERL